MFLQVACFRWAPFKKRETSFSSSRARVCSDEGGRANMASFIIRLLHKPDLLIFANSLVVFHNHVDAGGRVQRRPLQVELQHLRQARAADIRGVQRDIRGVQRGVGVLRTNQSQICRSDQCLWERIRSTSFQTGFTSLSITFVFFFSSEREKGGFVTQ